MQRRRQKRTLCCFVIFAARENIDGATTCKLGVMACVRRRYVLCIVFMRERREKLERKAKKKKGSVIRAHAYFTFEMVSLDQLKGIQSGV